VSSRGYCSMVPVVDSDDGDGLKTCYPELSGP